MSLDPALVMEAASLEPDPWQQSLLRGSWQRAILNVSRQAGKSTACAALAIYEAVFRSEHLVLVLSPSLRQSQEFFQKAWHLYREASLEDAAAPEKKNELRVRLENGSRILALPGSERTVRGYSGVDLLLIDEAARVEDDLYFSIRPMLAVSGGRICLMSTPFGKRGFFYEVWTSGGEDWHRVRVPATECPRITEEFLEEERRALGTWWFRQEYLCEFMSAADQLFSGEDIDRAFSGEVDPLFPGGRLEAREVLEETAGSEETIPALDLEGEAL